MTAVTPPAKDTDRLTFKVLGRTLEHFGVQMYKRREVAIAELVANAWDAGAPNVSVTTPSTDEYDRETESIIVKDRGCGMSFDDIRDQYLVLGRNRRKAAGLQLTFALGGDADNRTAENSSGDPITRRVMGRKGIGKLAGFGLGTIMTVTTWRGAKATRFVMDLARLKLEDDVSQDVEIEWQPVSPPEPWRSGTVVEISALKHKSPLEVDQLKLSLARRFSRTIRGQMTISVNGASLPDPTPELGKRIPDTDVDDGFKTHILPSGRTVRYWYGFANKVIRNKDLRGFAILANGKVAHAPPYFFDVEATASGQHSTRYVIGEIEADFLDEGEDDESDVIATDRQEIDWEDETTSELFEWGQKMSRTALAECRDFKGAKTEQAVFEDEEFKRRAERLDELSQREVRKFIRILGNRDSEEGEIRTLADSVIRAYEFRHFHDVVEDLRQVAGKDDPEAFATFVRRIREWRLLESRAILEIIEGRLNIIDKFESLLIENAPETAHRRGDDNLHDAIARFPWLLNPDWQVFSEEKTVTKTLKEWMIKDVDEGFRGRYDFLALTDTQTLVVIEIKRTGHPVKLDELQRLETYGEKLRKAHQDVRIVLIYGGTLNVSEATMSNWDKSDDRELRPWNTLFKSARRQYERHRAVLGADIAHGDFSVAEREVTETREVLSTGSTYRDREVRSRGLGSQSIDHGDGEA